VVAIQRHEDVDAFLAVAGGFLAAREAEHNLLLGICSTLQARPWPIDEPPDLFVVRSGQAIVLAAIRTPPYNLVLSEVDEPLALSALADAMADLDLPGVVGPKGHARTFAEHWCRAAGRRPYLAIAERIFRLTAVKAPPKPTGRLRLAGRDDRPILIDWFDAFGDEALPADSPPLDPDLVDRRIAQGGIFLWDDDGPVSLAGVGSRTPNGARVGPVYTPPELRGRGYASACVAGASQAQLDAGLRFVFLFTDLANPTANHIYQAIGYEPVRDVDAWRFAG
jgi:uncharacterized protein